MNMHLRAFLRGWLWSIPLWAIGFVAMVLRP